jgi:hypothetical protein
MCDPSSLVITANPHHTYIAITEKYWYKDVPCFYQENRQLVKKELGVMGIPEGMTLCKS